MKRILVVDDDVGLLLAYRLTLENEDIDLYATDDYRKAQLIVKRVDIDLVILDLVMKPRGDLLARRLISIRPDLKIIFISGYYKTDEIVRQLEFKVYGVFVKPLSPVMYATSPSLNLSSKSSYSRCRLSSSPNPNASPTFTVRSVSSTPLLNPISYT